MTSFRNLLEDLGFSKEFLFVVPDVGDAVVLAAFARDDREIAQGFHREQFSGQDLADAVRIGQILLCQINLREYEDRPLAAGIHAGDKICDVAPLGVYGSVLDAEDDGVGIGHILGGQALDALLGIRVHSLSHSLWKERIKMSYPTKKS